MRVTVEDIARMANVSKATVSRVLNHSEKGVGQATRERVQKVIDDLGYSPNLLARGISTSKTRTIGVIIPDITNPFFSSIVQKIEIHASEQGYTALICSSDNSEEKEDHCISVLITKHVDGVILASVMPDQTRRHFRFQKYQIPCVVIDRKIPQTEFSGGVYVDNEYAFFMATEFLLRNHHDRIAFLSGPTVVSTSKERMEGYFYALHANSIPKDPELVSVGEHTIEFGYSAIKDLHRKGISFSAVLASSDVIAIGAVKALKELKIRIPEEVEIIGFDNIEFSSLLEPALTTMEQPVEELARESVNMLMRLIQGLPLPESIVRLNSRMIFRQTTKNNHIAKENFL